MTETISDTVRDTRAVPDFASAIQALKEPGKSIAELDAAFLDLIATFGKAERRQLTEELLALPLEMFATLKIIRAVLVFGGRGKRSIEISRKLNGLLAAGAPVPLWSYEDRLKGFKNKFSYDVVDFLSAIKYAQSPARFDTLASAAEFYGPRFGLPDGLADTLYEQSPSRSADKDAYSAKLKQGFVVEHIVNDLCRRRREDNTALPMLAVNYESIWTQDLSSDPTRTENGQRKAAVFLTCHSSMIDHVKIWYKTAFDDGVRLGNGVSDKIVSSRDNPNAALLEAYRAAIEGKPLLIAADSPIGNAKNVLSVFGRQVPVADGFVFLSFESKADVFWTLVVHEGGRLRLRLVQGPSREEGEKIVAYRPRLLRFVEQQLEAYLTGPPEQIGLRKKWIDVLGGSGAEQATD